MPNVKQIEELKNILLDRKKKLLLSISNNRDNIDLLKEQDIRDDLDYAEVISDSFTEGMIVNHHSKELNEIDLALKKMNEGTYGICDMCSVVIPIGRLRAKPFAKYCTECRSVFEKEENKKLK
ncbi:molecular chaperone DnaK suppressor DksA [Malaciobacter molluscorum LMG 25693]|uniref:DnaK suppressor protein n=1 Tax=Malaciobacter molluscorum LMG 25693 TaxID=870501 RepID=A0A2G1DF65_9BACT|nr:RNA polymerase-binding protein DksA [Malaciobacter molluscorum]AXX91257.1 DnaK suppressor protein [Malaciobacter molluscorum LMG 25693]PHO17152.1 molecular chaperone DnaK suppressor DksA [Malaciobacter molluscorum LMG 25693]